jgi:rhodanese-related sulfurtransferase
MAADPAAVSGVSAVSGLDKATPVVVYCAVGGRFERCL